ncbi:MAG: oligosaccharide flippase family protein [Clostridia bacterium]|nr:oligosaccharide flippase family protein [Clostridia bacterium]
MSKSQREKGIMLSYLTMAVNFVIGIFFTKLITKMLGQSEMGLYNTTSSIITFMTMLDLGFGNSMIRFNARYRAQGDTEGEAKLNGMFLVMFSAVSVIAIIIGLVIYFNIEPFFTKFTPQEIERAKIIFIIMLVNICVSFPFTAVTALLTSYERFVFLRSYNLIKNVVNYGLQAVVLCVGFKSIGLAVASVSVSVISKIVPIVYMKRHMKVAFSFGKIDRRMFRDVISYSSFIFINLVVDQLYANTDKVILGKFVGTASVAIYGVAANLNKDAGEFAVAISGVFLPNITKLITKQTPMRDISAIFIRISRMQFLLLSFIFGGFLIFGRRFIHFWVGDEYMDSYLIALILMLPGLISLSQSLCVSVIQAMNKHRFRSVMYLLIAVINIGISIPLSIKWSGAGAAVGTLIGNFLGQILLMNWYYHRKIGLDIPRYWRYVVLRIGVVVAAYTALGYFVNHMLPAPSLLMLLARIAVYSLLFLPVLWYVIFNDEEKTMVKEKLSPIIKKLSFTRSK